MAIVATSPIAAFNSTSAALTYTTGSGTPVSGQVCYVFVSNRKTTAAEVITSLTGTGGFNTTWTQIHEDQTGGSNLSRGALFRGVCSSGTAGTLTATFAANQAQCSILMYTASGVDQATSEGVVQAVENSGSTGGALSVSLSAFGNVNNATFLFGVARGTPTGFAAESGSWASQFTGGINGSAAAVLIGNDTTPTGTLTSGVNWYAVAIEVKASTGTTPTEAEYASAGSAVVAAVGAAMLATVYASVGIAAVSGVSAVIQASVYNSSGSATLLGVGEDASNPSAIVEAEFNSAGVATMNGVSGATVASVYTIAGAATLQGVSGGVVQGSIFNIAGTAFVFGIGEDASNPTPDVPGNLYVPIRYVVGVIANVVPVETVLVGGAGVVPVREFIGPANVVPVREVTTETPRVKVVKV
jgi:hypothetical protein